MTDGTTLYHLPGFDDPFSAISHLFGAVAFLYLGALLLRRGRGDLSRMIFLGIYAFSCVLLFSMSGVYHMMLRGGTPRLVMERLDHGAIFVLIAGTLTPVSGLLFRGWRRWLPLAVIWTAAACGITFKTIFFTDFPEWLGLLFYVLMGWFGGLSAVFIVQRAGFAAILPLLYGGLAYTIGGITDHLHWGTIVPGVIQPHEIFHLAVLVGAFVQWVFIWRIASGEELGIPQTAAAAARAARMGSDLKDRRALHDTAAP
jgi:channel protein (hemolysin III family)